MPTSPTLSLYENQLIVAAAQGQHLDLRGHGATVRSAVLRALLRGQLTDHLDPSGVHVQGARFVGALDLRHIASPAGISLQDCEFGAPILLDGARLPWLSLDSALFDTGMIACVQGRELTVDGTLSLGAGFTARSTGLEGTISLTGARIGALIAERAEMHNRIGPALVCDGITVSTLLRIKNSRLSGGAATARLTHAIVGGELDLSGTELRSSSDASLLADGIKVEGSAVFAERFCSYGSIRLVGATIQRQLVLDGATLIGRDGQALVADGIEVGAGFHGHELHASGELRLPGATLSGQLDLSGAHVYNDTGCAINGERLNLGGNALFTEGFSAAGSGRAGTVRLKEAVVGGQLDCTDASLTNDSGPALHCDAMQAASSVFMNGGFLAAGSGELGAIRLLGAKIAGQMNCQGALIRNPDGPGIGADRLQVVEGVYFSDGFLCVADSNRGSVHLAGIDASQLACDAGTIINRRGPALVADGSTLRGDILLRRSTLQGDGTQAVLSLVGVTISGSLSLQDTYAVNRSNGLVADLRNTKVGDLWNLPEFMIGTRRVGPTRTTTERFVELEGLAYSSLPNSLQSFSSWLNMLAHQTRRYTGQPYRHLAAVHGASGHDGEVRRTLIAQRRDQIERKALSGSRERAWARFTGLTLGYGYRPWRALVGLGLMMTLAVALAVWAGASGLIHHENHGINTHCSFTQQISFGINWAVPLFNPSDLRDDCMLGTSGLAEQVVGLIGLAIKTTAWVMATLFVAGLTNLVRKT
jgi:hypothetical protein